MNKRNTLIGGLLAFGLLLPAAAQSDATHRGDSQKPVVSTYDKRPDPSGQNQSLDSATYDLTEDRTQNVPTYNKRPDPSGDNQKIDSTRYRQENPDNGAGKRSDRDGGVSQVALPEQDASHRGDTEKTVLPTYDNPPQAQSNTARTRPNDVSNLEEPQLGDSEKPVVPTYDKRPDPSGDNQKLDATRYDQENEDNNGQPGQLQMKVLEGGVVEQ
jgi:hypothetical protein